MPGTIHLLDLVSKEALEEILYTFTQATGVASIITELDGTPITTPQNFTSLCTKYCRGTSEGEKRCHASDQYGGAEAARRKSFVIYTCLNAGLLDSGFPIVVDGHHIANVLMGQVLDHPMHREAAIEKAKEIGIEDIDGYLEELEKVPIVSREQFKKVAEHMSAVTRNISDLAYQKHLASRRSRRYLNKLIDSVSDAIIATDEDLNIKKINDAGEEMFNVVRKSIIGKPFRCLFEDCSDVEDFCLQLNSGGEENVRLELTGVALSEETFPVSLSLSAVQSKGQHEGYVAVVRDITEEKKVARMKEDLVGMMTHDMGNPIISIQKALQILVDQILGDVNETQMEMLLMALGTGNQLLGLVSDFLDIYRSENGQFLLHKELISMESVLMKSMEQVQLFALEKQITINVSASDKLQMLQGDRTRLLRTCLNLIDNAIKYSPEGASIDVKLELIDLSQQSLLNERIKIVDPHCAWCLLTVTDYGPGVPKGYQDDIFDKFFCIKRKDGSVKERKGTGLGLSYCQLVAQAHKGDIWVVSPLKGREQERNKGCCFHVALPIEPEFVSEEESIQQSQKDMDGFVRKSLYPVI